MPRILQVFLAGLTVSFLGSLPLGTTNVAAMQLSIDRGLAAAIQFSIGSLTVELIYVRLSLFAVDWLHRNKTFMRYLNGVTLLILILLMAESFHLVLYPENLSPVAISQVLPPLLFGMFLCSISTAQIPFWLGWSTLLMERKILYPNGGMYWEYLLGIGLGTFLANGIFIYTGQWAGESFANNPALLHGVIGGFYLITTVWQIWRMWKAHKSNTDTSGN